MVNFNKNVIISKTSNDFTLIYDGIDTYYLYYKEKEVMNLICGIKPKELDKKTFGLTQTDISNFKEHDSYLELTEKIIKEIENKIDVPNTQILTLKNICGQLYQAQKNKGRLIDNFKNSSTSIQEKVMSLSELYGTDADGDIIEISEDTVTEPRTIEEIIEQRTNPVLSKEELLTAKKVKGAIKKDGLVNYLNKPLNDIQVGEHKNIYRKSLSEFNIMRGKGSYLNETTAKAEAGKSFEDEIVWEIITPPRYIKKINDITEPAFKSYSDQSTYYFNRLTILFGDFGSRKSFKKIEPVFNMIKPLITENEYDSSKMEKGENDWELKEIHLKVDSIGGVYSTTLNSFTEDDNQLISRTINSTPAPVDVGDVIDHLDNLEYSGTKQSKAKEKGIQKLKDFGTYMMSLVNYDTEIINPYKDIFKEYALKSDNPIREFQQQKELFNSYCVLTNYDCKKIDGYTVASIKQLNEYMNDINLENALIPYEYDFLKMIMADGTNYQLTMVRDIDYEEHIKSIKSKDNLSNEEKEAIIKGVRKEMESEDIVTLIECENNAFDLMDIEREDLTSQQLKDLHNKLHNLYGLRSRSDKFTGKKVFFKFNDLKYVHGRKSAYKNIDNLSKLLQNLESKGYIGKYDYKDNRTSENLYYLTPMCEELSSQLNLTENDFKTYWNEYKERTGI